jgi:hypothetical protein
MAKLQTPNVIKNNFMTVYINDYMPEYGEPTFHAPNESKTYVTDRRHISCKSRRLNGHEYNFTCCRPESRWTTKGALHIFRCHDCSSYVNKFKRNFLYFTDKNLCKLSKYITPQGP